MTRKRRRAPVRGREKPRKPNAAATWAKRGGATLGVAGSFVGIVSLLLVFFPGVKPCFGSTKASFTAIDVFPDVTQRQYLLRRRESIAGLPSEQLKKVGAEVRFTFETDGFRGKNLPIAWSLYFADARGNREQVVSGQDKTVALTAQPEDCSDEGSFDLFLIPPDPKKRYLVLLEIFRDKDLLNRISFLESKVFHG